MQKKFKPTNFSFDIPVHYFLNKLLDFFGLVQNLWMSELDRTDFLYIIIYELLLILYLRI